jgi:minor extracellular serine protease Vpr
VTNASRTLAGTADFYAWGLAGTNAKAGQVGIRAVGVQANAVGTDQFLFFAINTFKPWSNNAENEFDLLIDTNGDGQPDFAVIAADLGSLTTGTPVGQMVTAVLNLNNPAASPGIQYPVTTPTDGSTMLIPVFASDIGVTAAAPRFAYSVQSFSGTGATDVAAGPAKFNAFSNAVSTASFVQLAAGQHASVPMVIDPVEWAQTPALGVMVVGLENLNRSQARLFGIGRPGDGQ